MDTLEWLQEWYHKWCDGSWEHLYKNVAIESLDNPGWFVQINLIDTNLESKPFKKTIIERTDLDWLHCFVEEQTFKGAGGPHNLKEILEVFRKWANS